MKIIETFIKGLYIIEPKVFEDQRGYFFESYSSKLFKENGIDIDFVQDNQSKSSFGVIRGLHYQLNPYSQSKLVRVLEGSVYDVAVDLRSNSKTYGQWFGIELSAENKKQLLIPKGFAHGFSVLTKTSVFSYKCDDYYNPDSERGIKYNDEFKNNGEAEDLKNKFFYLSGEETLEGYFLPDTYYFHQGSDVGLVAEKVISNFNDKVLPFFKEYANFKNSLKIASLLEKEISDKDEQRIVAGILEKRLKAGMPLQIDATIVYIKCDGRFLNCGQLKKSDYKIDSPFNTYIYNGLVPAPISNPSLSTIEAAINRKDSPYWYYLSDAKTGRTIFSKTFDEHNANRSVYFLN